MAPGALTRTCGECAACCTADPVLPLNKPAGVRCPFQQGDASKPATGCCSIYGRRPKPCQTYRCEWLAGHGPDDARPDRSGVIAEVGRDATGTPRVATLIPAPGFEEDSPGFSAAVEHWRNDARCIVTTPTTVYATDAELAWLRSVTFQFADGITIGPEYRNVEE